MTSPSRLTFLPTVPLEGRCAVTGELDAYSASQLATWLEQRRAAGHRDLQLDLSGLDFVDSVGARVLAEQGRAFALAGGRLELTSASPAVARVLQAADVDTPLDPA